MMIGARAILLAVILVLASLGARAADLVVWWEKGVNPEEDQAVREIIAAFEHKIGKRVELVFQPHDGLPNRALAALAAGEPPDFLFGLDTTDYYGRWAHEGRLVDLADTLGPLAGLFFEDLLEHATLLDASTGKRSLYALPMARSSRLAQTWR
jgi:multiple sugar transport system substrate-binding protein